ncbi:S41 family peptidase [Paenibacillus ehimensis]|uniref:S41 family peptidase n=1 Tax=Paenibacillus ehimensis TaxID=79264 RepID=UPI0013E30D14|nr:S41 family peptidase [Paenibacillus ehimensis]
MWRKMAVSIGILVVLCVGGAFVYLKAKTGTPPHIDPSKRELWQSEGYNYILEMDGENVIVYNFTKDSLLPFAYGQIEKDGVIYVEKFHGNPLLNTTLWKRAPLGHFQNGILTEETGAVKRYKKIDELPKVKINAFTKDPIQNFETLWQIFDERFSLFELAKVDWKQVYEEYRPKVTEQTSEEELRLLFKEMIGKLNDGHTMILSGTTTTVSREESEREKLYNENEETMRKNILGYLNGPLQKRLNDQLQYGQTKDGIGYIDMNGFGEFDMKKIDAALADVAKELAGSRGVVIDLRFNGGGSDAFAVAFANRFADQKKLAFSKQARSGGHEQFLAPTPIYIKPQGESIPADKIVVMTSEVTASAAEIATMSLKEIDRVTVIGETTRGIHSDVLMNILPNEWIVMLSAEQYKAADGKVYERVGLKPDEEVLIRNEDIQAGKDPVLARAIELLKS